MPTFSEVSQVYRDLQDSIEQGLIFLESRYQVHFVGPKHDIAHALILDILEFKPLDEEEP